VDVISGAVVAAAMRQGKEAPASELMVQLVHAMEAQS
jgi:ketopantoate reductase